MRENPALLQVNVVDAEDCDACAELQDWPCAYHEGFAAGFRAALQPLGDEGPFIVGHEDDGVNPWPVGAKGFGAICWFPSRESAVAAAEGFNRAIMLILDPDTGP